MEDVCFEFLVMKTRLSEIEKELYSDENNTNTYLIELIEFMKDRHTHNKNCFLAGVSSQRLIRTANPVCV